MSGRSPLPSVRDRAIPLPPIATWAALSGIVLVALLFGYVASRADAVLIATTVAGVAGLALLARPAWGIWVTLVLGLLVVGLVPLWADQAAGKAVWGVSILGFALLLAALVHAAADSRVVANTPGFVWLTLLFIVYALLNSLLQFTTPTELIGGFKRYFSMYGLIFCLAWLPISDELMARWRRLLLVVALVQLPWAVYQLIKFVPIREGLSYAMPGIVPVDVVSGTFGATLTAGGSSGEMTAYVLFAVGFLLARLRERCISLKITLLLVPLLVAPLFIGETKIVLLIMPLFFVTLYRHWILKNPGRGLIFLVLGAALVLALGFLYIHMSGWTVDKWIKDNIAYNFGNVGHGGNKLNRTTTLMFWLEKQGLHDPISAVFGNGLGVAMESTIPPGYIARRYAGLGVGLTGISTLLWETGILGFTMFAAILFSAWRSASKLMRARERWVRADAAAVQATLPIFFILPFYRSALLEQVPIQIVFACCLGYLGWLCRRGYPGLSGKA